MEKTFYKKFVNQLQNSINYEIDSEEEDNNIFEDPENDISIYNEEEAAEYLDLNEDNNSQMSINSNIDGNSSHSNNEIMNNPFNDTTLLIHNNTVLSKSNSNFLDGFSHLRTEDIKSYLGSFGEGNKDIFNNGYNEFKNFSRKLDNMDNWKFTKLDNNTIKNNNFNKEKGIVKPKKVQALFDFCEDREITENDFEEFFESKESKAKKLREINNPNSILARRENTKKRNTKKFYNFGIKM